LKEFEPAGRIDILPVLYIEFSKRWFLAFASFMLRPERLKNIKSFQGVYFIRKPEFAIILNLTYNETVNIKQYYKKGRLVWQEKVQTEI